MIEEKVLAVCPEQDLVTGWGGDSQGGVCEGRQEGDGTESAQGEASVAREAANIY